MDEKLRREMIFKVLGWGTFVYLIVVGYSINQSGLFEFRSDTRQDVVDSKGKLHKAFEELENAQFERADQLESEARESNDRITRRVAEAKASPEDAMEAKDREKKEQPREDKFSDAAKLKVEAAQLRMDVFLAREQRMDSHQRAQGLIGGALFYGLVLYPVLVWGVYKRTDPGVGTEKDVIPLKWALVYAFAMGILTCVVAYRTAMN
ncbi:MAG TPA: hypothetical protein VIT19_10220 [Pyrinomonadaceae bacterium]